MPDASTQTDIKRKLDTVRQRSPCNGSFTSEDGVNLQYDDANSLYPSAMVELFNERRELYPELYLESESLAESSSNYNGHYNGHYMAKLLLNCNSFKFSNA